VLYKYLCFNMGIDNNFFRSLLVWALSSLCTKSFSATRNNIGQHKRRREGGKGEVQPLSVGQKSILFGQLFSKTNGKFGQLFCLLSWSLDLSGRKFTAPPPLNLKFSYSPTPMLTNELVLLLLIKINFIPAPLDNTCIAQRTQSLRQSSCTIGNDTYSL